MEPRTVRKGEKPPKFSPGFFVKIVQQMWMPLLTWLSTIALFESVLASESSELVTGCMRTLYLCVGYFLFRSQQKLWFARHGTMPGDRAILRAFTQALLMAAALQGWYTLEDLI